MPSALETLVKILKLERDQGYTNKAVIGGLSSFSGNWKPQAQAQARRTEHFMLVDELSDLMRRYDDITSKDGRDQLVRYMVDRITGRTAAPSEYAARDYAAQVQAAAEKAAALTERAPNRERPERERPARPPADESARPSTGRTERPPRDPVSAAPTDEPTTDENPPPDVPRPPANGTRLQRRDPAARNPTQHDPAPRERRAPSESDEYARESGRKGGREVRHADSARNDALSSVLEKRDEHSALNMERELNPVRPDAQFTPDVPPMPQLARPPRSARISLEAGQAADITRGLRAPVEKMQGVGPKMALLLNKLSIFTIEDMLFFKPRRYDDYTKMLPINRLQANQTVTIIGTTTTAEVRVGKGARKDFFVVLSDGTARMNLTFFGQHWLSRQLRVNQQIVVRGTTSIFGNRIQMNSPEWEFIDSDTLRAAKIVPVYPLTADLTARVLRQRIKQVVDFWAERLPDPLPLPVLERTDLADIGWALQNLHNPGGWDHLMHAKRRLIFDQLLLMQLVMLENRRTWQAVPSQPVSVGDEELDTFYTMVFPYPLTGAQRRSINEIRGDMAKRVPMNRLLQGDVGSGKTAVAISAIGVALLNKTQAALMAPTGILAEQHYRNVGAALAKLEPMLGYKPVVALLTGSITASEREAIYRGLADGSIDVAIGTHALIQTGVEFNNLTVAIIDEQHRFGVEQRGALRSKGQNPHLLVMTATPIPRTMALTMYADLDLSIIDEMPPGRTPVRTRIITKIDRERVYHELIEEEIKQGRQAFIVYSLVEPSEEIDAESATAGLEKMTKVFYKYKVGLLHGKMKASEKDDIMAAFRDRAFDVLVTTSVAEVGVDIPNATVMLIEDANRFGLSQLHQFRGRVGRGTHLSYCLLVCETPIEEAKERLLAMERYTDGFKLAEIDWKLRGAGDLIGTKQSGSGIEALMEEMTPDLVEMAQHEARAIHAEDPDLQQPEHRLLAQRVLMLRDARSDVS
ncbi:MAG: ATP-dependent DNA helicase RecG [Chloroflexota bacterium]|nr:ATP-dependent DNA helicase RecG [Chloroflexota bacterium]